MTFLSVSDVARSLDVAPKAISYLFCARVLDDERCPVLGGRRLIPESYLPAIREVLLERGKLQEATN